MNDPAFARTPYKAAFVIVSHQSLLVTHEKTLEQHGLFIAIQHSCCVIIPGDLIVPLEELAWHSGLPAKNPTNSKITCAKLYLANERVGIVIVVGLLLSG